MEELDRIEREEQEEIERIEREEQEKLNRKIHERQYGNNSYYNSYESFYGYRGNNSQVNMNINADGSEARCKW